MKTYSMLCHGMIVEQSGPEVMFVFSKVVSCLFSHILLNAWFGRCLVFVSGELVCVMSTGGGLGRDGT